MLPKSKRLNLKKDFKWVADGKKIETRHFKIFYQLKTKAVKLRSEDSNELHKSALNLYPLVGIALTKQFFKQAHERNKARRNTSKVVEGLYSTLRNNINLVIMPKAETITTPVEELEKEVKNVKDLFKPN